ncbi:hypothetical protein ACAH01_05120 [Halomicrobium sp. HM KBTZ05]|uniref:STAS/SEC14 domain-containing protein n=1 Tax=Halomicrobium mukohataei TaxID=57705 RepID=A0A847UIK1_9EURY|nr:hypothetical protein [Halomicrobium mukohataei]NLV11404.1 hypothetical protein [Halomicrobium mukohataei]
MKSLDSYDVPVDADDHGEFVVWDLRSWSGDVETMEAINEAWVATHEPAQKVGTISVFPDSVVVDGQIQSFISEGWNEAAKATGLEYLAIVGQNLQTMAVEQQIDAPSIEEIRAFQSVDDAIDWLNAATA